MSVFNGLLKSDVFREGVFKESGVLAFQEAGDVVGAVVATIVGSPASTTGKSQFLMVLLTSLHLQNTLVREERDESVNGIPDSCDLRELLAFHPFLHRVHRMKFILFLTKPADIVLDNAPIPFHELFSVVESASDATHQGGHGLVDATNGEVVSGSDL